MYNGKPHGYPSYQPYPPPQGEPSNAGWIPPTLNYPPDPYPQAPGGYYNMPMTGPGPSPNSYNVHAQASSTSPFHATPPFPSAPPSFSTGYTPPGGSSATSELGPTEGGTTGVAGMGLGLGGDSDQDKSVSGGPKKRRKTIAAASGSPTADDGKEKRTKTGRACDACRTKKIRCDILPQSEGSSEDQPICAHCKQYNLECTFFLPITETRFKKKKTAEDQSGVGTGAQAAKGEDRSPTSPVRSAEIPQRLEGPSSLNSLLGITLPAETGHAYDLRHHHSWEVSEDGNGLIRIRAPPSATGYADADPENLTSAHNRLNRPILSAHTITLLVNAYFDHLCPLFPIISRAEFTAMPNPSPLLLYSICGLGATRRQFPRNVFASVRGVINGLIRSNDILSDARFENVQALLLLAQVGDLHAQPTAATASAALIRMGIATRMAQDLGLHRESNLHAQTAQDLMYVERRRRVWATCVILDRWFGAALGVPLLVDLLDCDVLLPAHYEVVPDKEPSGWNTDINYHGLSEHLKLSILVGRVLKTIYSPAGLKHVTNEHLEVLLADMTIWHESLPEQLKFKGNDSSDMAGLLHLSYAALHFLFWRVFMRITYTCPAHLTFGLEANRWTRMNTWAREGLEWLSHHDDVLDSLFIYPYTATSCALVQYHTWARRNDPAALETLKLVRDTVVRWEAAVQPDQMSIRRKTCETMTLLYEAALKTNPEAHDPKDGLSPIHPISDVNYRNDIGRAVFVKDAKREGGGLWVAKNEIKNESVLRDNAIVLATDLLSKAAPEGPAPQVKTAAAPGLGSLPGQSQVQRESRTVWARTEGSGGDRSRSSNEIVTASSQQSGTLGQTLMSQPPQSSTAPLADPFTGPLAHAATATANGRIGDRGSPQQQEQESVQAVTQRLALAGTAGARFETQGQKQGQGQGRAGTDHFMRKDLQMAAGNVNPQLDFSYGPGGQGEDFECRDGQGHGQGQELPQGHVQVQGQGQGSTTQNIDFHSAQLVGAGDTTYDLTMLDGFPTSGLNFDLWNSWFESIDKLLPAPDQNFQGGRGQGGMQ